MKLIDTKTGAEIRIGASVTTFRGEKGKLINFEAPHRAGSTGRVYVKLGRNICEFFPSVINAQIVSYAN